MTLDTLKFTVSLKHGIIFGLFHLIVALSSSLLCALCIACAREIITRQIEKDAGAKRACRCGGGGGDGGAELGFGRNRARN